MRETGKATLYLTRRDNVEPKGSYNYWVSNWPGSLQIKCVNSRKGRHNIVRVRYDVDFKFEGNWWHGTQYGDNTQIVHCRRVKS